MLGFDVLIDMNLKVWLLEINYSPSLNIYFEPWPVDPRIEHEPTEEDICPVDLYVKSRVVTDTILLATSGQLSQLDNLNSLTRIHPMNKERKLYDTVVALKSAF